MKFVRNESILTGVIGINKKRVYLSNAGFSKYFVTAVGNL